MPQTCTICKHKKHLAIDKELLARVALRDIARRYRVSKAALARHKKYCLPKKLALIQKHKSKQVAEAQTLDAYLRTVRDRLDTLYNIGLKEKEYSVMLGCLREMRSLGLETARLKLDEFLRRQDGQQQKDKQAPPWVLEMIKDLDTG